MQMGYAQILAFSETFCLFTFWYDGCAFGNLNNWPKLLVNAVTTGPTDSKFGQCCFARFKHTRFGPPLSVRLESTDPASFRDLQKFAPIKILFGHS